MRVAVIGAGWAGCAAAVEALRRGHEVSLYEAARVFGGRARAAFGPEAVALPGGWAGPLDNGQHILIGAYAASLQLMRDLGTDPEQALLRLPLRLLFPDGLGLRLPRLPSPLDAVVGIARARGWSWADKLSLLRTATGWQAGGFRCAPDASVASLCQRLSPRIMAELMEPLCVSALNTPPSRASGQVFLRVIQDSLFAPNGGSHLLLPRRDLSALLPNAAAAWLERKGASVHAGRRMRSLRRVDTGWQLEDETCECVILACPPWEAVRLLESSGVAAEDWLQRTRQLQFEAITTVYAYASGARLAQAMLVLRSASGEPAQFVFDRGQLDGPAGLLAFVVSASQGELVALQNQVIAQGRRQLALPALVAVQTVVEKRATFACTPGLQRPPAAIAPGLLACGDYVEGPYPATLEGAVLSGLAAARLIS